MRINGLNSVRILIDCNLLVSDKISAISIEIRPSPLLLQSICSPDKIFCTLFAGISKPACCDNFLLESTILRGVKSSAHSSVTIELSSPPAISCINLTII